MSSTIHRTTAIHNFLNVNNIKNPIWNPSLETQIIVERGDAEVDERVSDMGRPYAVYLTDSYEFKGFRIPRNADSDPEDNDIAIKWPLDKHVLGIGSTGWNWRDKISEWVGFDFDDITGHKAGLSGEEISEIIDRIKTLDWVTIRRSKGGRGIHIFVNFAVGVPTQTHTEHSALAKAVLNHICAKTGFDFTAKVDCMGGVMWVWHKHAVNIVESRLSIGKYASWKELYEADDFMPFKLIKQGSPLEQVPTNWRNFIDVIKGNRRREITLGNANDDDLFEAIINHNKTIHLDEQHRALIDWLDDNDRVWWWVGDSNMLVCHTFDLKEAHTALGFKGIFETLSTGKDQGRDQNCFGFPKPNGSWVFRRHGRGANEHPYWDKDSSGWTRCVYNKLPDVMTVCRTYGGVRGSKGDFEFQGGDPNETVINPPIQKVMRALGFDFSLPPLLNHRACSFLYKKEQIIIRADRGSTDPDILNGWRKSGRTWEKVLSYHKETPDIAAPDDKLRHVVQNSESEGFYYLTAAKQWVKTSKGNIIDALKADGLGQGEIQIKLGKAIDEPWTIVCEPFEPEYVGGRKWNRNAAQLSFKPQRSLSGTPTWDKLFNHIGTNLTPTVLEDEWCKEWGIVSGGQYLRLWAASLFQRPKKSLPYLFLYSVEENTGKTTFHRALGSLFVERRGYMKANSALQSAAGFNGELASAVLCVIEEIDLSRAQSALERVKDWVTSDYIDIHQKHKQPVLAKNYTHWIQCANNPEFFPMMPGDTRVCVIRVPELRDQVAGDIFMENLKTEAAGFLHSILSMEIPKYAGRMSIPTLTTVEKQNLMRSSTGNAVEEFIENSCYKIDGSLIPFKEFCNAFRESLDFMEREQWSDNKISRRVPPWVCKGKYGETRTVHLGNLSLFEDAPGGVRFAVSSKGELRK